MTDLAALQRFAIPGSITIDAGCGGLPRVSIATPTCRGEVYLHGAHVTAWQPTGQAPVIWMGSQSWFAAGKPIRGGIPVCWPWFGPAAEAGQPAHGLVRLADWELTSATIDADGTAIVVLRLALPAPASDVRLTARFGRRLEVELAATNTGSAAFTVGEALHTYLAVADVRRVAVRGLGGAAGADRVATPFAITGAEPITVAAETDLLFEGHTGEVVVDDAVLHRQLRVAKRGSRSTVVWNPWIAKAARLPDFGDHEWPGMICVEAANALGDAYPLAPGATHRMATVIEVL
jgi:glucose-6-phosphate 1-epimerase